MMPNRLEAADVVWWNEVQKDLYTDLAGNTFGVELDLFNDHMDFYIRYADGYEKPFYTDDIYKAIKLFNEEVDNETERRSKKV